MNHLQAAKWWGAKRWIFALAIIMLTLPVVPATPAMAETTDMQDGEIAPEEELVYIGEDERIYVLDTHQVGDNPLVEWVSPDDDWRSVDVGDFNNDGDMEIIAIGGGLIEEDDDTNEDGKLVIYDPVRRNGGPEELYRASIDGKPELVKAGNFDPNLPGDEFLVGFKMHDSAKEDPDDEFRIEVWKSSIPNPDGAHWEYHIDPKDDGNAWTFVTSGDLGDGGPDEVGLIDDDGGEVSVYRLTDGWRQRIYSDSSSNDPYRSVAFGDFFEGPYEEVFFSRNVSRSPSLFYMRYYPGEDPELQEDRHEIISPYPRLLFLADVNGSGDDELFFLRRNQEPRLASRNDGADPMPILEEDLDDDNGYKTGTGGDLDGDGNAEIIILRDDRIRIYENRGQFWNIDEHIVRADTDVIRAGDLDGQGGASGPSFAFSDDEIAQAVEVGKRLQNVQYSLTNDSTDDVIGFTYYIENNPSWVSVTASSSQASAAAPAYIYVSFDATNLDLGTYETNLVFTAYTSATNSPFVVPITLTVQEAQVTPDPSTVWYMYENCDAGLDSMTQIINIGGSDGVRYNAAIIDQPALEDAQMALDGPVYAAYVESGKLTLADEKGTRSEILLPAEMPIQASAATSITWPSSASWLSAESVTGEVPDTLTLVATPEEQPDGRRGAVLVLVGDSQAGYPPTSVRTVPINLLCIESETYLPTIIQ